MCFHIYRVISIKIVELNYMDLLLYTDTIINTNYNSKRKTLFSMILITIKYKRIYNCLYGISKIIILINFMSNKQFKFKKKSMLNTIYQQVDSFIICFKYFSIKCKIFGIIYEYTSIIIVYKTNQIFSEYSINT